MKPNHPNSMCPQRSHPDIICTCEKESDQSLISTCSDCGKSWNKYCGEMVCPEKEERCCEKCSTDKTVKVVKECLDGCWNNNCPCHQPKKEPCGYFIMPGIGGDTTCAEEKPCKRHGDCKDECGKLIRIFGGGTRTCPNKLPCPMGYHSGEEDEKSILKCDNFEERFSKLEDISKRAKGCKEEPQDWAKEFDEKFTRKDLSKKGIWYRDDWFVRDYIISKDIKSFISDLLEREKEKWTNEITGACISREEIGRIRQEERESLIGEIEKELGTGCQYEFYKKLANYKK